MGADPANGEEWRSANFGPVGSVLVVRKDGKDVTAQQVEALVRYCRDMLLSGMIDVDGKGEEARSRFVEENICWAKFEVFFEAFKKRRISKGDEAWKMALSLFCLRAWK
jgi:hypothetical protein